MTLKYYLTVIRLDEKKRVTIPVLWGSIQYRLIRVQFYVILTSFLLMSKKMFISFYRRVCFTSPYCASLIN